MENKDQHARKKMYVLRGILSYEMWRHQLIPVDGRLEDFLLKPDLVVALELIRQLHGVTQHASQPVIDRLIFRILPEIYIKCIIIVMEKQ